MEIPVLGYQIRLSWNNNKESFYIPVLPETIDIKEEGQGKSYNVLGSGGETGETRAGEINVIQSPKLREVRFSSIFPAKFSPVVNTVERELKSPMFYIDKLRKWIQTMHPIRFIFIGGYSQLMYETADLIKQDLNMPVSIESFEWKEVAGSPGDIEYSISLKEYVFYSARRSVIRTRDDGKKMVIQEVPDRPDDRVRPETYISEPGDTLTKVSMKFFNMDSSRYKEIGELSGLMPWQFYNVPPGTVLRLPRK